MTTLSTLIGSAIPSFGLGDTADAPRPGLWQRIGGVFRRRRGNDVAAMQASQQNALATDSAVSAEALHKIVNDDEMEALGGDHDEPYQPDAGPIDYTEELPHASFGGSMLPPTPPTPPRRRPLTPPRDSAIDEVRAGMSALASLLHGIQQHMERQGERQDELADRQREVIACLSHLPMASAIQNESLIAIRDQITQGVTTQTRLCSALERLGGLQETTGEALTSITRRIDQMDARDANFASSMEKVCDAMQTVSRASETGAIVLERVRNNLSTQQDNIKETLDKHQNRFNALMAVAIAVSVAALAVVAGVGYLVLSKI